MYPSVSFSKDDNAVLSVGSTMLLLNPYAVASSMMFWAAAPASKYQNGRYFSPAFFVLFQFNTVIMERGAKERDGRDDAAARDARLSPFLIFCR